MITTALSEENTTSLMVTPETASQVLSAQVRALIESRYIVAKKMPRDIDRVRQTMLKDCKRPYFAEVALYSKPIGTKNIEGPSIRFAESAIRSMGNIVIDTTVIYDDAEKRIIRVSASDIESNTSYSIDVTIQKTIERKQVKQGDMVISKRFNSKNELVYLLEAKDDEIIIKQNALISKAIRTIGLRLIPGDIIDECMDAIRVTQRDKDKADPDSAKNKIFDSFETIGVSVDQIKDYLGSDLKSLTPKELQTLRGIYQSIRDGEISWRDVIDSKPKSYSTSQENNKPLFEERTPVQQHTELTSNQESTNKKNRNKTTAKPAPNPVPETSAPPDMKPAEVAPPISNAQADKEVVRVDRVKDLKNKIGPEYIATAELYLKNTRRLKQNETCDDVSIELVHEILDNFDAFMTRIKTVQAPAQRSLPASEITSIDEKRRKDCIEILKNGIGQELLPYAEKWMLQSGRLKPNQKIDDLSMQVAAALASVTKTIREKAEALQQTEHK